jgi:hypothetical protein
MVSAGRHEGRLAFHNVYGFALDREHPSPSQHHVNLIVFVRLLPVGLRRDENIDPNLEARRAVDDLVASVGLRQPSPGGLDVERVRRA